MKKPTQLVLIYTLIAGVISALTAPIPATSLLLTALEILTFIPFIGWIAEVIVAVLFVFFLGILLNLYFSKLSRKQDS